MNKMRQTERKEHDELKGHKYTFLKGSASLSIKRKKELSKLIKLFPTNTGRKRLNIQGAINLNTHDLISTVHETLDKQSTIEILKKIEERHRDERKIYVMVDNAGYYRAQEVKKYLRKSKIGLVFLPPYAPHLSLIEKVWRHLKKTVLYNQYYPTFKDFTEKIESFLRKSHRKAFKNLLTEKFHFVNPNASMLRLAS